MKRLENKIAVITGGGSGIGRATALRFADEGAHVIIWDVADKKGEEAITALKDKGSNAAYYHVDTTDRRCHQPLWQNRHSNQQCRHYQGFNAVENDRRAMGARD